MLTLKTSKKLILLKKLIWKIFTSTTSFGIFKAGNEYLCGQIRHLQVANADSIKAIDLYSEVIPFQKN